MTVRHFVRFVKVSKKWKEVTKMSELSLEHTHDLLEVLEAANPVEALAEFIALNGFDESKSN